jgi:Domain of unknown function (DUF4136)
MTRTLTALATLALAASLAGCASMNTVQADLSTWGEWPAGRAPGSYAFDRLPSQQARPEETERLEQAARPALERAGFTAAADGATPDVLVQVAARTTRTAPDLWRDPLWWRGGYLVGHRAWVGPVWRIDPFMDSPRYERQVALLLRDGATGKPLYEARVANEGSTLGSDALIGALFQGALVDFPRTGVNPRTVSVTLP